MIEVFTGIISGIVSGLGMGGGTILILIFTIFLNIEQAKTIGYENWNDNWNFWYIWCSDWIYYF